MRLFDEAIYKYKMNISELALKYTFTNLFIYTKHSNYLC